MRIFNRFRVWLLQRKINKLRSRDHREVRYAKYIVNTDIISEDELIAIQRAHWSNPVLWRNPWKAEK